MARTEFVSFTTGGARLDGYLARPEGEGPFPGVVVIHEGTGFNENIRDVARRLADEGYAALAVDLFSGRNRVACIFRLMSGLLLKPLGHGGISDLKASLSFLARQPGVDNSRLGAIGFCMGGGLAIAWACTDDRLSVVAPYYAINPRPLAAVARACPLVGSYPGNDFTASHARKLDAELDRQGVEHDVKIYPGARH